MLIAMFVFGYNVPFLLLLFGLIMYIEHLRFCFVKYLADVELVKEFQSEDDETPKG